MVSVILPAYNEQDMIEKAARTINDVLEAAGIERELLFVDDGSTDGSWAAIEAAASQIAAVRGIRFSRNFGKESAIYAGLFHAKGDCCVVIDCDLQHPPEKIVDMVRLWEQGYEIVEGVKTSRGKENALHTAMAGCFYKLLSAAVHMDMQRASDFKLLDRKAVTALLNIREKGAFFRALSSWIGFRTATVEFEVQERTAGTSKWSAWSLVKYALANLSSFSSAPMQLVTIMGGLMLVVAAVFGVVSLWQKFAGVALPGFTTVILLQLLSSSLLMLSLGVIGFYIARIYEEVKGRPRFIVSEECGGQHEKVD